MNDMTAGFYTGNPRNWREKGKEALLPGPVIEELRDPAQYIPSPALIGAVNVALTLGQPLLLTGQPGTGKTDLALNVARELGLADPLKIAVKSSTTAESILYHFDAVRQFRDANLTRSGLGGPALPGTALDSKAYVTFVGLGQAILLSRALEEVTEIWDSQSNGPFPGPTRSVVLIDEIDKADRDVPNDLLNEVDLCEFTIPELHNQKVKASKDYWPVVIFTSNSERSLPDAFLRRCIYYHIDFPSEEQLRSIIDARIPSYPRNCRLVIDAVEFLSEIRSDGATNAMRRPPSTAELLSWLRYLQHQQTDPQSPLSQVWSDPSLRERSLGILAKTSEDRQVLIELIGSRARALRSTAA